MDDYIINGKAESEIGGVVIMRIHSKSIWI